MRARLQGPAIAALSIGSATLGAGLVACFDLFHSTADVHTACDLDARASGCPSAPGSDASADAAAPPDAGATDFCAWPSAEARQHAQHACAWLGACETPMGRNAFGPCMFEALLAYDCAANPNHGVTTKAHALWDCLWQVKSCRGVDDCVFPQGTRGCGSSGNYTACGTEADGAAVNTDVRVECVDGGVPPYPNAHGENCAFWGQTCASDGVIERCAGAGGLGCGSGRGCSGTPRNELLWCVDGGDVGIDCANRGTKPGCNAYFPNGSDAGWVACMAESDAGSCPPDASAACSNGIALSCPSGVLEKIDCASLLQSVAGCTPGALAPPFDWTSPCGVVPEHCTESCTDAGLTGCARGAAFALDCAAEGLGPCGEVSTDKGSAVHAACAPPR
jgi:hypothetical protein